MLYPSLCTNGKAALTTPIGTILAILLTGLSQELMVVLGRVLVPSPKSHQYDKNIRMCLALVESNRGNFRVSTVINPILVKIIMIKLPVTVNIPLSLPVAHTMPSLAYRNSGAKEAALPCAG